MTLLSLAKYKKKIMVPIDFHNIFVHTMAVNGVQ